MAGRYELIITEKPNAAKKIAEALADGKSLKKNDKGVPYYEVTHGDHDIVVACAVGHLYTIDEDKDKKKKNTWTYPVFDVKWIPSSEKGKDSGYTKKYLSTIKKLSKDAKTFTIATDFDIEGEVIGLNVLRYACNQKDGARMKFSTLTKDELRESYDKKSKTLDWGQANAGIVRHELDWYYGINLSRALTISIKKAGNFKIMSSGRVQGPALKMIVDHEKDIRNFKPEPFWEIELDGAVKNGKINAWHEQDKFWEKEKASAVIKKTKGKDGKIASIEEKEFKQSAPTPFDLTTLQIEAFRVFRISPKDTLSVAQELYTGGYISYPRTSSQQLPPSIGFSKILGQLKKSEVYSSLASKILAQGKLEPNNGSKTDPAHPAVYPTGIIPELAGWEEKIYDLIVKRFLATFAPSATRKTMTIKIDVNSEIFVAKGTRTTEKGWHEFYMPYVKLEEEELPKVKEGENVKVEKIVLHDKQTQPPKRYTPASIIKELEKRNLGTKSTRAQIVDTLFQRGYVSGEPMEATDFGIKTIETLEKYSPSIIDEELTRHFEEEMDEIREHKKKNGEVLDEARTVLSKTLTEFKKKEKEIGAGLVDANQETQRQMTTIGKCMRCNDGTLVIKRGKFGKFIACDKYPDCSATFKLPSVGLIKPCDTVCEACKYPMITIVKKKRGQDLCINPDCPKKKISEGIGNLATDDNGVTKKVCPKCSKGHLVLRKSVYGQFYGCSEYPKCKHTEKPESKE